ncbi:MAG: FtsX-like permease family protein [Caldilineaceae bacterium]|nr:FtsX-like permease family protein [Caldilineaceae bacterium]
MNTTIKPNLLKPRWRKVFLDLWNDKTRTGLVVASITAGVFAIGMIISAFVILQEDISHSYAAVNPPNIEVWTDPFDKDLVRVIEKTPGVDEVEGRRLEDIRARRSDEDWQNLVLVGLSDFAGPISLRRPLEGESVPGKDEVVLSEDRLHSTGFHPGDKIEVELPDGSSHTLTVVGLVADQTISKPDPNGTGLAFVTMKTLGSLGQASYFNRLYATVEGDGNDPEIISEVADRVQDKIEQSRNVYRLEEHQSDQHPMADIVFAVLGVLGALGGLITILGSSLIINTFNALMAQQLRQIGVMKLIGARSVQILGMYLTLILAYGLIALILALPLGAIVGYGLAWFIAYWVGAVLQGFRIIPLAVTVQILVAILIPLGAGFFPVNSGAKTSVLRAISDYRPGRQSARGLFHYTPRWVKAIPRPLLLSFRNTFRKRGRLLLTLFTLTVAGAVFIAVFNVRDSVENLADQLLQHFMGDVTVDLRQPYRVRKIEQALLEIPGVEGVEGWTAAAAEVWDENDDPVTNLSIIAPPQDTQLLDMNLTAGRWLLPNEEKAIVMSDSIYQDYPDLKIGDSLRIKLLDQHVEEWQVVGIFPFLTLFGDPIAYANFEFIAAKEHQYDQAASYRIITEAHDAASQQALTRRIDDYLPDRNFMLKKVESGHDLQQKATVTIDVIIIFLLMMAILTAFVGSLGLAGAMSINVLERTREIGVMRAIGAVDKTVMRSVIIEALVIGLISWILAIGLSFPVGFLLLRIIGESLLDSPIALNFTPLGILLWLAIVIILSVFASIIPARNAARLTINEVLAYE